MHYTLYMGILVKKAQRAKVRNNTWSSGMRKPSNSQKTNSCRISCFLSDAVGGVWATELFSWPSLGSSSQAHSLNLKPWSIYCNDIVSNFRRRINRVIANVSRPERCCRRCRLLLSSISNWNSVVDLSQQVKLPSMLSLPRSITARLSVDPNIARGMTFFTIAWTNDVTWAQGMSYIHFSKNWADDIYIVIVEYMRQHPTWSKVEQFCKREAIFVCAIFDSLSIAYEVWGWGDVALAKLSIKLNINRGYHQMNNARE
jgi:hypothetical protein